MLTRRALLHRRPAIEPGRVHHRKVQLLFGCAELVEQIKSGVDDVVGPRPRTVHLVDHHDRFEAQRERLLGHETGLRHRAFHRVDQQHHTVHHRQGAFHFAAEVGVAGRVHDVDVGVLPVHGAVLGQDGDAAFLLQVVAVHHAFGHFFIGAEGAALAQQHVHQGGLAVVHVGDDGDVANLFVAHGSLSEICRVRVAG